MLCVGYTMHIQEGYKYDKNLQWDHSPGDYLF